jgi:hypothetical protein
MGQQNIYKTLEGAAGVDKQQVGRSFWDQKNGQRVCLAVAISEEGSGGRLTDERNRWKKKR